MHWLKSLLTLCAVIAWWPVALDAAELRLTDGAVLRGEIVPNFNDQGVAIRSSSGTYSERVHWSRFTQESLKELAKFPDAKEFAEPFIEIPLEEKEKARKKEIIIKPVDSKLELPAEKPGLLAAITTPAGLFLLLLFVAGNVYAGYQIAMFRNQPVSVVCAVSALVPILGPIIFLSMPTQPERAHQEAASMDAEQFAAAHPGAAGAPEGGESQASLTSRMKNKLTGMFQQKPAGGGLSLAAHTKPGAAKANVETKVYRRSEHTINRRFIETQFPGFFRVVPSEAEKDLVLVFKSGRGEYIGKRITRISATELHLQVLSGAGEISMPLSEISEIQVRHKDAKPG